MSASLKHWSGNSYIAQVAQKSSVPSNFGYVLHSHFHVILSFCVPYLNWFTPCHLGCDSANQTEETFVQVTTYALINCVSKEMTSINLFFESVVPLHEKREITKIRVLKRSYFERIQMMFSSRLHSSGESLTPFAMYIDDKQ